MIDDSSPDRIVVPCTGILFDCDGVLVDSDQSVVTAWRQWAADFGLDPDEVMAAVHGVRAADTVAAFIAPQHRQEALQAINELELELAPLVTAIPGAADLLADLSSHNWAVATSATHALATVRLGAAGLPLPPVLVTADDVARGKPHPDPYLTAAALIDAPPAECIVLEDAKAGIAAARGAEVGYVIGVGRDTANLDVDAHVRDLRDISAQPHALVINRLDPPGE